MEGDLERFQNSFDQRFACTICLEPKLRMVSGSCQHRICEECLYDSNVLRQSMKNCPICLKRNSFPPTRPDIPAVVIETQRCLGVQQCSVIGCDIQMWFWEVDEHISLCHSSKKSKLSPNGKHNETPRRKSRLSGLPLVSTTRRLRDRKSTTESPSPSRPRLRSSSVKSSQT